MSHLHHVGHTDRAVPAHRDDTHFWEEGLCQWYHSPAKCLLLCCFTPCTLGAMRSKYLNGSYWGLDCLCDAMGCLAPQHLFNQVRRDRKLQGTALSDCFFCLCCIPCHGTRVWREIDRTVDGSHGLSGVPTPGTREWSSAWKDCMQDKSGCAISVLAYCCPYVLPLATCMAIRREDRTGNPAACCISHAYLRNSVRRDHGIDGNYCFDCLWSCLPVAQCLDLARIIRHTKDTGGVCRDRRHQAVVHEDVYEEHATPAHHHHDHHDHHHHTGASAYSPGPQPSGGSYRSNSGNGYH
eukprot:TRINITY_DN47887_c0_g1_i1.p1 TRINITY_DN47887_c0_g1~~TRINITY_DN47887_c0_g1_i1.p1  ORF type:complete len:295 (-),score=24.59 TRINITY_DN47887_c0_g1_i1:22-906(-)